MSNCADLFWQAYLVNFLFWAGLAQGAVVLAATLDITGAGWGRPYVRIARSFAGFLPVCVALFAVFLLGRGHIFPWIAEPIPEKAAYLNVPFLAARGLLGLSAMAWLSWMFLGRIETRSAGAGRKRTSPWSVALVIAFMGVYSYLAFDLIMSLRPHWHSTLLGAHYAVSCFYLGIAGLVVAGCLRAGVPRRDRGNLCKLMFGVSPFWISLLWSQYIVIWYGNMPGETHFVYLRFYQMPWTAVTLVMLGLAFVAPFCILMPRRAKLLGATQLIGASCAIAGLLLEKFVFVAPSFSPNELAVGWIHLPVTAAFAALFAASYRYSARRTKPVELSWSEMI